ncbi:MAG: hypothetical protein HY303_11675 [Candidatus Wallbacteria bacterium]|nr:hypothetical protein [Candidatus Wallbacteria bacterium]
MKAEPLGSRFRQAVVAIVLVLASSGRAAGDDWAVVNRAISPLLDRPSVTGEARMTLYAGMRVLLLDTKAAPGYAKVSYGDAIGFMRSQELLRGFLPEDRYPGPNDQPEKEFLASDRNGDGVPDFRDIVHAARDMIGLAFDDAASLRLDESGQTPDGLHAGWAHDGKDNDGDGVVDNREEDVLVCIDLLIRAVEAAGFPMTRAILDVARSQPEVFREGRGAAPIDDELLARRVRNVVAFTRVSPDFRYFPEPEVHDPTTFPRERARPGDLLFFGLTKDLGKRKFKIQHSGICVSVNPQTGLPVWIITAVVPRVQFLNLEKGYHRFTYCGHARLTPAGGQPRAAVAPEIALEPAAPPIPPPALSALSPILGHPPLAGSHATPAVAPVVFGPASVPMVAPVLPLAPFVLASPVAR